MKISKLFFTLLLLIAGLMQSMAYDVTVKGVVIDENGNGVDQQTVTLEARTTDPNVGYRNEVTTANGDFRDVFDIPSGVSGTLIMTTKSCRGEVKQRFAFSERDATIQTRLQICQVNARCAVDIKVDRTAAGGIILIAEAKGTAPFKYEWSNGQTTQRIKANDKAEYCVTVTDANGCKARACEKIKNNDGRCKVQITPRRDSSGNVTLYARAGGEAPFTYEWSTGETTESISITSEGEYCVKITDANGCESKDCFKYGINNDRCAVDIKVDRTAAGGIILIAEAKGTAPFKYEWSNGETTQRIKANDKAEYCVTVTDANGCQARACEKLKPNDGRCKVEIVVKRSGRGVYLWARAAGEAPFKYEWSTGETTARILAKPAGEYCVKITDANGCESKACHSFDAERCDVKIAVAANPRDRQSRVLKAVTTGAGAYKYEWSTGETTPSIVVKNKGTYCVTVYTPNCRDKACVTLPKRGKITPSRSVKPDMDTRGGLKLYPNPASDRINVVVTEVGDAQLEYQIMEVFGNVKKSGKINGSAPVSIDISDLDAGYYYINVVGADFKATSSFLKK